MCALLLGLAATAQERAGAPASRRARQVLRLQADLRQSLAALRRPHAFCGEVQLRSHNNLNQLVPLQVKFSGACDREHEWFQLDDWRVLQRAERLAVRRGDAGEWREPRGDTPDVPLTPRLLLPHLLTAELAPPEPTTYDDRPAMRARATWRGTAVKKLMFDAAVPSSLHEGMVEALANAAARGNERVYAQATTLFDPATRAWISSTLRFVYLDGRPFLEGEAAPPLPRGLPPLPGRVLMEGIWHLEACPPEDYPKPALSAEARRLLAPRDRR